MRALLLALLMSSGAWAQTDTPAPPLLPAEQEAAAPEPEGPPASEEAPRDRTFVNNAGVTVAVFTGGALLGGLAGGVGGAIGGVIYGASFGTLAPFMILFFGPVFAVGGVLGGAILGGGLGLMGSFFFIPPPAPVGIETPANVITVSPGDLVARRLSFEYERRLSPHFTLYVAPMMELGSVRAFFWHAGTGPSVTVGVRGYVWGQAPRGAFIGVQGHAGVGSFSHGSSDVESHDTFGGAGLTFGHSWLIANHFAVSAGLGAIYQVSSSLTPGSGAQRLVHEFAPMLRLNAGGAF